MGKRLQHRIDLAGLTVIGWGPHDYRMGCGVTAPDVSLSFRQSRAAEPSIAEMFLDVRLRPLAARALAQALLEAAEMAECAPITEEDSGT